MHSRRLVLIACLIAGTLTVGCGSSDTTRGGANTGAGTELDAGITAAVQAAFEADPILQELDISVDTFEGIVFLESDDTTRPQRELAVKLAREVANVIDVVDQMK